VADGDGSEYAAFVQELEKAQEARKTSIEQRGLAVVTTAGAIVALLFGLAGLSIRSSATFTVSHPAAHRLVVGVVLFVVAAALALLTNIPLWYRTADYTKLSQELKGRWKDPSPEANRQVSATRLKTIQFNAGVNTAKAWLLFAAVLAEVAAAAFVAWAIELVVRP
jgi:hypothetical protein